MDSLSNMRIMIRNNRTGLSRILRLVACGIMLMILLWVPAPFVMHAAALELREPEGMQNGMENAIRTPDTLTADSTDASATGSAEEQIADPLEKLPSDPSDTLTITTGYRVWPLERFEVKKTFTLDELEVMTLCLRAYTYLDETGALAIEQALGVRLTDLLDAAGITLDDIEELVFTAGNGEDQQNASFSKEELLDTQRFCNYSLSRYYDTETGTLRTHKRWNREMVETLLAVKDYRGLAAEGAEFDCDEENLIPDNRFRLVFGQADPLEKNAIRSLCQIHTISIVLSGSPPLEMTDKEQGNDITEAVSGTDTQTQDVGETGTDSQIIHASDQGTDSDNNDNDILQTNSDINTGAGSEAADDASLYHKPIDDNVSLTGIEKYTTEVTEANNQTASSTGRPSVQTELSSSVWTNNTESPILTDESVPDSSGEQRLVPIRFPGSDGTDSVSSVLQRTKQGLYLAASGIFLLAAFLRYRKFRHDFRPYNDQNPLKESY